MRAPLVALLAALLLAVPGRAEDYSFPLVLPERVVDGDTLVVSIPGVHPVLGRHAKVRLRGVNAPESTWRADCELERQKGLLAKAALRGLVERAERLELRRAKRGSFFRVVAEVWAREGGFGQQGWASLGEVLVEAGLAVRWDGSGARPRPWCDD